MKFKFNQRYSVADIARKLNIRSVPDLGVMDMDTAIQIVKSKPQSSIAIEPKIIEGIVTRSFPLKLFRDGTPIIWKLKVRDFDV